MLTPQEVAEHAFTKASFGGYNMAMVDEFLDQVTADYTSLYKENTTLKAKMKVLADKVEEYRSTEDAMRKALLSAQRMADQMVAEAEVKKASIVQDAEAAAQDKIKAIRQEVANEEARLTAAQASTSSYIAKLKDLYQQQMDYINGLNHLVAAARQSDRIADTADSITSAVDKAMEEVPSQEAPEAPQPAPVPLEKDPLYEELKRGPVVPAATSEEDDDDEEAEPTRRIDFDHLKFGKDYDID